MSVLPPYSTSQYRWMAVVWTLSILLALSLPASSLSPVQPVLSADKVIHFGLFFVFGALWMRALYPPGTADAPSGVWTSVLRLVLLGGLFAGGTELYQQLIPVRRMVDPYDAVANGAGLITSLVVYVAVVYARNRPSEASPR